MVYTVDLLGDANLRVRDLTITRNTYLANVVVDASADLNSVTTVGNTTTNSIEITSAQASTSKLTGALKVSGGVGVQGNVHVGSNLFVESNLEVGTANLFVDTTTGNVGIGTTNPTYTLDVHGTAHLSNIASTDYSKQFSQTYDLNFDEITATDEELSLFQFEPGIGDFAIIQGEVDVDILSKRAQTFIHFQSQKVKIKFNFSWDARGGTGSWVIHDIFIDRTKSIATATQFLNYPVEVRYKYKGDRSTDPDIPPKVQVYLRYNGFNFVAKINVKGMYHSNYIDYGLSFPSSIFTTDGDTTDASVDTVTTYDINTGNVGIGTTSPIAALDINAGPENDTTPALAIRGGLYDESDLYVLNSYNVNTGVGYAAKVIGVNINNKVETDNTVKIRDNEGGLTSAGAIYLGSDDQNQGIFGVLGASGVAGTTLTEHLTVRAEGNVGIGTTSPEEKLDVRGNAYLENNSIFLSGYDEGPTNNTEYSQYVGKRYSGRILAGMEIENVRTNTAGTAITNNGEYGQKVHFRAHDYGLYGGGVNQRVMTLVGANVGIGSTLPNYKLDVNGTLRCFGFTNSSSDDRIKYNEQNVSNTLTLISQLKPQKYEKIMERPNPSEGTWIPTDDEWENVKENYKYGDEFGFIAQDVREVPELAFLVNGEETRTDTKRSTLEEYSNLTTEEQSTYTISYLHESNVITQEEYSNLTPEEQEASVAQYTKEIETQTPLSLNYNGLFVLAIGAIQELKAKNDALEARILALEGAS
jgi:hypothetical protein